MGDIGLLELFLLLILGIIVFGGDLPDVARKIGFYWGKLQVFLSDVKRDLDAEFQRREIQKNHPTLESPDTEPQNDLPAEDSNDHSKEQEEEDSST